jgi:hypothetical protein
MKSSLTILKILSFAAVLTLVFGLPASATSRVKSGSGYGPYSGSPSSVNGVSQCAAQAGACLGYADLGSTTLGGLAATEYLFTGGQNDGSQEYDVFDLGTSSLNGSNLAAGFSLGIFTCGTDLTASTYAFDSTLNPVTDLPNPVTGLPCSPIQSIDNPAIGTQIAATDANGHPFDFTLKGDGSVSFGNTSGDDIVVFEQPLTATPEPASKGLLAIGIAALAALVAGRKNC